LLASFGLTLSLTAPAPPQLYSLSLHDALPISKLFRAILRSRMHRPYHRKIGRGLFYNLHKVTERPLLIHIRGTMQGYQRIAPLLDRKSTRLNSSHVSISYAVFCLKKKKENEHT